MAVVGLHDEYAPAPGAHAQSGQEVQNDYRSGDDAQAPSRQETFRQLGNDAYKRGKPAEAVAFYTAGIHELLPCGASPDANKASAVLWSNIAACYLQTGDHKQAVASCSAALAAQPRFVKALYRRAQARRALGDLRGALEDAEAARAAEPSNSAVCDLVFDIEDQIEALPPSERRALPAKAPAAAPAAPGSARAGGGEAARPGAEGAAAARPSEAEVAFAIGVMDELRESLSCAADAPTQITLMYTIPAAPPSAAGDGAGVVPAAAAPRVDVGRIGIEGAFESAAALDSALAFARGQHLTLAADCAVVVVPKSKVQYPLAWWAGDWPFASVDQEGVFVELHSSSGATPVTWFLPEGYGVAALGPPVELSADCGLLVDMRPLFPPRA